MGLSVQGKQIVFSYGGDNVLNGLSFCIRRGDFVTILGPNGSGKSTLLKTISAELRPTDGGVWLENKPVLQMPKKILSQQVAVVPQESTVEYDFSVLETVLMGRMPHQRRFQTENAKDIATTRQAMEQTDTWQLRDRLLNQLSGGERQRVFAARALTQEPKVLLLDEPTSHLDIQHQLELLELVARLNREQGLTVIAVLHDLNLAAQFSQRIILLKMGEIVAEGIPSQVLTVENIEAVYQVKVRVNCNQVTGRLHIQLLGKSPGSTLSKALPQIHLVGGGGSAGELMEELTHLGFPLSCGVLNIGDSDWQKAKSLGIAIAEEAPFAPISQGALQANMCLIQAAELIVLLPVPFGMGNLPNLLQIVETVRVGKKVIVVGKADIKDRDFTGGQAENLFNELLGAGTEIVEDLRGICGYLKRFSDEAPSI